MRYLFTLFFFVPDGGDGDESSDTEFEDTIKPGAPLFSSLGSTEEKKAALEKKLGTSKFNTVYKSIQVRKSLHLIRTHLTSSPIKSYIHIFFVN